MSLYDGHVVASCHYGGEPARDRDERGLADRLPVLAGVRPARHRLEPALTRVPELTAARNAVGLTFFLNGLRLRQLGLAHPRGALELRPHQRPARPASCSRSPSARSSRCRRPGPLINAPRHGARRTPRVPPRPPRACWPPPSAWAHVLPVTVVGLFVYGLGIGVWDVAMNVEGAEVERGLRPHDHAALPRRLQRRHGRRRARSAPCWSSCPCRPPPTSAAVVLLVARAGAGARPRRSCPSSRPTRSSGPRRPGPGWSRARC